FKQAESTLLKSLDLNSNGLITQFNLGILYKTQGNTSKAIEFFQNSLQINPQYTEAYYQIATTHLKAKNKESAKLSIQKGLKVDPDNEKFKKLYEQVVAS
ncbi:MAG: tetratricopeptide repeat protein, partial [Nitrospinota bacterium]|nr:tetratricopeptide repeat protein [Nitrospinota bacterium]